MKQTPSSKHEPVLLLMLTVFCQEIFIVVNLNSTGIDNSTSIDNKPTQAHLRDELECQNVGNEGIGMKCVNKTGARILQTDVEVVTIQMDSNNSAIIVHDEVNKSASLKLEWYVYTTSCMQEDVYSSLESCMTECAIRHTVDDNRYTVSSRKNACITHKVLVLVNSSRSQYIIDKGRNLIAKGLKNFNEQYYLRHNNNVFLCLPLEKCFEKCETRYFYPNEYKRNGGKVWVDSYNRYYEIEEYYFQDKYMIVCGDNDLDDKFESTRKIHEIGCVLSSVFLAVTVFIVFVSRVKKEYNRPLKCYVLMLFFGYVTNAIRIYVYYKAFCGISGFMIQYFFLSSFFWGNCQAIDLYITLKKLQPTNETNNTGNKKFIFYCIYSWGIPGVITGMTVLANLYGSRGIADIHILEQCWFRTANIIGAFVFHYGWMAITLLVNIVLFILIMKKFQEISQTVFLVNRKIYKQLFSISIKLFILMGFCWIVKIIAWAYRGVYWQLSLIDSIVTSFHGIFVFFIYSFKVKHLPVCLGERIRRLSSNKDDYRSNLAKCSLRRSIRIHQ